MATPKSKTEAALRITRTFEAPREKVFRAWTDPEIMKRWMAPSDEYATRIPELELRVGGRYRLEMEYSDGKVYAVAGTYREIRAPEKLVYTWKWVAGLENPDFPETLVTVVFREKGRATEVVMTHELLPDEKERESHEKGWSGCFERLGKVL